MKLRIALIVSYFFVAPLFLIGLILYQSFLHNQVSSVSARNMKAEDFRVSYNSVPSVVFASEITISPQEARVDVLREFFARYDSPLEDFADEIVSTADRYGLDYRLLPAIAMQESTLCLKAPKNTNNCWGFGIYGKKRTSFDDLGQAIETVSKTLASEYHGKGLVEPIEIMSKYTPSNNGEWAENVSYVMDRIASQL